MIFDLELRAVSKRFDHQSWAVRDVSLTLPHGEFLTLLGPSGSGKTTTLMMVAGFETPTSGQIIVQGQDIGDEPPQRRNLGVVFQGYGLFPHLSVLENVAFPLRMRRMPQTARRQKAVEMLERVGLSALAARRPRALSGGQQQRVALARALVFEPRALLLDEPLSALDRRLREQLQIEIKDIQRRLGISVLLVTHDQDEAMMMSDRIAVMHEGRIVQIGTPAELYLRPATAFVASFLGETNLVPAAGTREGCILSIRPEKLKLLAPNETADGIIEGVIENSVFLGRHARTVVRTPGQTLVISGAAAQQPGAAVRLGWSHADAHPVQEDT